MKIFSVRGIPIRLHWTFFLILPYVAFGMARQFAAFAADAHTSREALLLPPLGWGIVLALLLFASVLLHELGHVFVARTQGSRVRDVTLMLLGGVSHIEQISRKARDEAKMAVVGPLVSLAIAGVAYAAHLVFDGVAPDLQFGLYYLAQINAVIALFNLLPAFPLDGGRVLRSMLEPKHGRSRATVIAANTGKILAALMALFGLLSGNFLLILIAVFVWSGGTAEATAALHEERLVGVPTGALAHYDVGVVLGEESVARAAAIMLRAHCDALLVRGPGGAVSVLSIDAIAGVPAAERGDRTVASIVRFDVPIVDATTPANDAVDAMQTAGLTALPVLRGGAIAGVVDLHAVERFLRRDLVLRPVVDAEDAPPRRSRPSLA